MEGQQKLLLCSYFINGNKLLCLLVLRRTNIGELQILFYCRHLGISRHITNRFEEDLVCTVPGSSCVFNRPIICTAAASTHQVEADWCVV